ncbi:multidrug resistance-associated protein 1-like [Ostrea edulis]|uniref:multidrug resistance-associated protein 1-like n=1 Tax=Ostrea edulis TaxID=37623 RepID=UPI0024AED796|nr:multidrug resistance-associated protein 1-like [Ostrea edulis]
MEDFCNGTEIWNTTLTWRNSWPDFTECFQNTVIIWVVSGWLWLTSPLYLYYLIIQKSCPNPITVKFITKIVLILCLLAICITEIVTAVHDLSSVDSYLKAWLIGPCIEAFTLLLVLLYIFVERNKGFVTSGVLFIYWTLANLCYIIPFYRKIINKEYSNKPANFAVFNVYYFIALIQWAISCTADKTSTPEIEKECPEVQASFLSRITFWWLNSLMISGYKTPLTEDKIFKLNPREQSKNVIPKFEAKWKREKDKYSGSLIVPVSPPDPMKRSKHYSSIQDEETSEKTPLLQSDESKKSKTEPTVKGPSLIKALFRTFGWELLHAQIFKLFYDVLVFVLPALLKYLIQFSKNDPNDVTWKEDWKGYVLAAGFFVTVLMQSFFFHQLFYWSVALGLRIRACLVSAVYKKALTMSNQARKGATVGEIVNLMSVDTENIQHLIPYLWGCWSSVLQIGVALYFLYDTVKYAMLAGLGFLILLFPFNGFIMSKMQKLQKDKMKEKDNRIKLLTEVLNGIKILKLYAWEMSFKEKIEAIRNVELSILKRESIIGLFFWFSWILAPYMVSMLTFGVYVYSTDAHYLSPEVAFVAISLLNILRFAVNVAPMMMTEAVKAVVSLKRLSKFLNNHDLDPECVSHDYMEDEAITIKDGSFMWDPEVGDCLKNINLTVDEGSLVAVVGQVGSGKSSILSAILGEMIKVKGHVNVRGSVAYVPQQAWIQNNSLQNNILFSKPMKSAFYQKVIKACALQPDIDILSSGDATEIGENGINLSGGQKQRVSLARAVYHDTDVYLLDDPLSAVDSHVGKHLFDEVIGNTGLLKRKTRVLVTHGVHWLPKVDKIIVLINGSITEVGTYEELLDHAGPFAEFLTTYLTADKEEVENEEEDPEVREVKEKILLRLKSVASVDESDDKQNILMRLKSVTSEEESDGRRVLESEGEKKLLRQRSVVKKEEKEAGKDGKPTDSHKLIEEEKAEVGSVKLSVFITYARAIGTPYFVLYMVLYVLFTAASVFSNTWISYWTEDDTLNNITVFGNSSLRREKNDFYFGIYGGLGGIQAVLIVALQIIFVYRTIIASRTLHQKMLYSIVRSPMSFFDTTPVGRIVNRFSDDISTIDGELPNTFFMFMDCLLVVIGALVVISFSTPIFMSVILPLGILYFLVQRFYITTSRQLKRLESKTRSPIYSHFGESVTGASVIRAFGLQNEFIMESQKRVDTNQVFTYASNTANRWLGFRLELLGNFVILAAIIFAVLARDTIKGGIVGLSISYALQITENLNWFVRMVSELETNVVAVERVSEYTKVPTEADLINEYHRPSEDWPSKGEVEFQNYSTKYRSGLDLVLKNINFNVNGAEKVGIVGRTGAGKSSLTLALFRLIEPTSGSIVIDKENLAHLGLHDSRSRLTILPQDPVLFSGTLRMNLDPMSKYTDQTLWEVLEHAHLKDFIQTLPTGLEYDCGEGGQNLSVGQKQLLCLARALLRKTKILILDEATAAVDMETDELIQNTIKQEFRDCTVLTIAHRLNTVIDYDRIMVLDNGVVKEFDSPQVLLKKTDSLFYQLAKDAGIV